MQHLDAERLLDIGAHARRAAVAATAERAASTNPGSTESVTPYFLVITVLRDRHLTGHGGRDE